MNSFSGTFYMASYVFIYSPVNCCPAISRLLSPAGWGSMRRKRRHAEPSAWSTSCLPSTFSFGWVYIPACLSHLPLHWQHLPSVCSFPVATTKLWRTELVVVCETELGSRVWVFCVKKVFSFCWQPVFWICWEPRTWKEKNKHGQTAPKSLEDKINGSNKTFVMATSSVFTMVSHRHRLECLPWTVLKTFIILLLTIFLDYFFI